MCFWVHMQKDEFKMGAQKTYKLSYQRKQLKTYKCLFRHTFILAKIVQVSSGIQHYRSNYHGETEVIAYVI